MTCRRPDPADLGSRADIGSRTDIDVLVRGFYGRALTDPLLAPVFDVLAVVGLDDHLVVVGDFWEQILFRTTRYEGAFAPVHRALHGHHGLTPARFARWLELWIGNVDALFAGENAERAKAKAEAMARSLARSLGSDVADLTVAAGTPGEEIGLRGS